MAGCAAAVMGTSGAYTGSGGKEGRAMRAAVRDYLDRSDSARVPGANDPVSSSLVPALALHAERLASRVLRRDDHDKGEQPEEEQREASDIPAGSARRISELAVIAGRAAAAAYAYKTGDARTLERLRICLEAVLDAEDEFELLRRIVDRRAGLRQHDRGGRAAAGRC